MNIVWHGYSCIKITENIGGNEVSIVIDPFVAKDKKMPRNMTADLLLISHDHDHHNNRGAVSENPFVIDGPGEYEVKDILIRAVPTFHDNEEGKKSGLNTMFYMIIKDMHVLHLGDLKHKLEPKHMTDLHRVDVLFLPVGGGDVLDAKEAVDVVAQLEPRIIIPIHYRTGDVCGDCGEVDAFLKAMGFAKEEAISKAKINSKDLPQDETRVILLDPQ